MTEPLDTLNRLTKWRSVFAGWQLGTRLDTDPECQAVRDHRDLTMLLRVEVSALVNLLMEEGAFTASEYAEQLRLEAEILMRAYEQKFPGARATDEGMTFDVPQWFETTKGWRS